MLLAPREESVTLYCFVFEAILEKKNTNKNLSTLHVDSTVWLRNHTPAIINRVFQEEGKLIFFDQDTFAKEQILSTVRIC